VNKQLQDCSQMLDQSIEEVRAQRELIERLEQLNKVLTDLLLLRNQQLEEQEKLIEVYEKRRGLRISFLFGLIKISKN
ncbi:hypothetical protein KJJ93_28480, partial [Escherichia coli]|uniref:hypothetical protein n=1 Tax=Escherichia coli TaxID=562 RepID=UPI001BD9B501